MRVVAGVGSRKAPPDVLATIERIGGGLARRGVELQSGGAPGCDTAWERGWQSVGGTVRLYLPWPGFPDDAPRICSTVALVAPTTSAYSMARQHHPRWDYVSSRGNDLLARTSHVLFGARLNARCDAVICWTLDGADGTFAKPVSRATGGTGQAIRLARFYGVPVFNIANHDHLVVAKRLADLGWV